jgi:hypothetical protein
MHRRYNRWWSRFDQPDPYDGSYDLTDPQSFNRYAYVQNDPVNFIDPSGLDGIACFFNAGISSCGGDNGSGGGGGGYIGAPGNGGGGGGYSDLGRGTFYDGSLVGDAEANYLWRLQNTYDAIAATRALRQGDLTRVAQLMSANPTLFFVVQPIIQIPANATLPQIAKIYLDAFGLFSLIDTRFLEVKINKRGEAVGLTFQWLDPDKAERYLRSHPLFGNGIFGFLHVNDVGFPFFDARSFTSRFASRSLQVTSGPRGGFADTDLFNPYQDLWSFIRHGVQEVLWPDIRRLFRRRGP